MVFFYSKAMNSESVIVLENINIVIQSKDWIKNNTKHFICTAGLIV